MIKMMKLFIYDCPVKFQQIYLFKSFNPKKLYGKYLKNISINIGNNIIIGYFHNIYLKNIAKNYA